MSEAQKPSDIPRAANGGAVWAVLLTAAANAMRFVSHPWNLAPVGASGLFAGAKLRWWHALALVLGLRAVSDTVMQLFSPTEQPFRFLFSGLMAVVYASLALNVLIGRWLCRDGAAWRVGAAGLLGSVQFFLVTNFYSWLSSVLGVRDALAFYPPTWDGLVACYVAALPFFRGTLAGDLIYSAALFGAHAYLTRTAEDADVARVAAEKS